MIRLKQLFPFLAIVLSVMLFYPTIWMFNETFISSGMVLTDLYLFNYPLKELMHQSLLTGHGLPMWTDLIGNGYPIFAEGQMGPLYPLHLFLFILPLSTLTLFNFNLLIHFVLAGWIMYLYIKNSIKLSKKASFFGAIIYLFCGYTLTHLHQVNIVLVIMYFPLNLFLADKILSLDHTLSKRESIRKYTLLTALLSLVIYLQITVGHIEMAYYNILFTLIYVLIRVVFNSRLLQQFFLKMAIVVTAFMIAALIALPQILSTYELVNFSQREEGLSYEHTTGTLWPIEKLVLFVNPHAFPIYYADPTYRPDQNETVNIGALYPYIGIIPLLLSLFALITLFLKNTAIKNHTKPWIIIFAALSLFTYLYAVGRSTELFAVIWQVVPGLKFFRYPVKGIYIIEFSLSILSAIGFENLINFIVNKGKNENTKTTQKVEKINLKIDTKNTPTVSLQGKNAGINWLAMTIALVLILSSYADLWLNNRPIQPTIPSKDWLSTPPFASYLKSEIRTQSENNFLNWRVYSHGTNNVDFTRIFDYQLQKELQNILHIDFNLLHQIPENREWVVLFLQRQTQLNKTNTGIDLEKGELSLPPALKKSLNLQSTKYLLSDLPIIDPDLVEVKTLNFTTPYNHHLYLTDAQTKDILVTKAYLYENKGYYPRINITPQSNTIYIQPTDKSATNVLQAVRTAEFNPRQAAILENQQSQPALTVEQQIANLDQNDAHYSVVSYAPEYMEFNYSVKNNSIFTISDTYYPGWHAYIDNKEVPVYKANYAFKGIELPAGEHRLKLIFVPTYFSLGIKGTIAGVALLVILTTASVFLKLKKSHEQSASTQ